MTRVQDVTEPERPSAEQMLERVRREAGAGARGRHRMYVGMAPGVGKTYAALEELHRRRARGTDAVVAYVETYGRPLTEQAIGDLEIIPRRKLTYEGVTLDEMDLAAVIQRAPDIVLVDEIAHANAPGSRNEKRWQDVEELLTHGITVLSTMNIQHLESLADIVEGVTGVPVRERVPDAVLDEADEVQLVDLTPHALRQRIRHGNVYPPDRAAQALENYFREGNLTALREMVLRRLSTTVEGELQEYMLERGVDASWPACEGVMVVVDPSQQSRNLVRRAWRTAEGLQAPLTAVWVDTPAWGKASPEDKARLEENLRFAEDIGAEVTRLREGDAAAAILKLARDRNVESIFVSRPSTPLWRRLVAGQPLADQLIERGRDERVGIHVTTSQ